MRLLELTFVNIKRYLKNPVILVLIFILPIVSVVSIFSSDDNECKTIEVIDNDKSVLSQELIDELSKDFNITIIDGNAEKYFDDIRENKFGAIYVIEKGFAESIENKEVPKIKSYIKEEVNGLLVAQNTIDEFIKKSIKDEIKEGLNTNYIKTSIEYENKSKEQNAVTIVMICYFLLLGSSIISEDILKLKKQKVLKRTITTGNSDICILGGMFLAAFIVQSILSILAFIFISKLADINELNTLNAIIAIVLTSLLSTSLITFLSRWIKNPQLISFVSVIYGMFAFGLGMLSIDFNSFSNIPNIVESVSIISPFYWINKISLNGEYIMPIIVVVLMSLVFFTAGSFKLRDFVKE